MTTGERFYQGTGRRKRSVARVRVTPGATQVFVVDGKPLEERFRWRFTAAPFCSLWLLRTH